MNNQENKSDELKAEVNKLRNKITELKQQKSYDLEERVKELNCLYSLSKLMEERETDVDEMMQKAVKLIPPAFRYPEYICARIVFEEKSFLTGNFKETKRKLSSSISLNENIKGTIEVFYLKNIPGSVEGQFLKEEKELIDALAKNLGQYLQRRLAENAVRESEEKYRIVFENTGTAMCILEKDGTISLTNAKFAELSGFSVEEIQNKKRWMEFVVPEDLERMHKQHELRRKNREKALKEYEFGFMDKNRRIKNIHLSIDIIPDTDKSVASLLDMTAHKQKKKELAEQEKFIKTIMDNLPVGIAVNSVFPSVEFIYMNDNFPRIYRTTREELSTPDNFWNAVYKDPDFKIKLKKRVEKDIASGDPQRMHWEDIPVTRRGKETRYINAYNIPVNEKNVWISTVIDVTEQKKAVEELKKLKDNLEALVEEKTSELKKKLVDLERFHEATIEREFRIKELRNEIATLKKSQGRKNKDL